MGRYFATTRLPELPAVNFAVNFTAGFYFRVQLMRY
jgi:hypothetical protein